MSEIPDEITELMSAAEDQVAREAEAYLADPIKAGLERLRALPDDRFKKGNSGLEMAHAAAAISNAITYGWSEVRKDFLVYNGSGRWVEGRPMLRRAVFALLGDDFSTDKAGNLLAALELMPDVQKIGYEPVEQDTLINVRNGLVEWRTGQLLPHVPERCGVTQLHVDWKPGATCQNVEQFLAEVLPADCLAQTDDCPQGFIWE